MDLPRAAAISLVRASPLARTPKRSPAPLIIGRGAMVADKLLTKRHASGRVATRQQSFELHGFNRTAEPETLRLVARPHARYLAVGLGQNTSCYS
jgi:hypothetical protein